MLIPTFFVGAALTWFGTCHSAPTDFADSLVGSVDPPGLLAIEGEPVDRGLVPINHEAVRPVRVKNRSEKPLRLKVLGSSCHWLQHRLGASQLAPGEQTDLVLTVLVTGGFGQQDHFLVLEAQEQGATPAREEVVKVGISFTPERTYEYLPRRFVGTVRAGVPARWSVFVARKTPGDLVIDEPTVDVEGLSARGPLPVEENPTVQRIDLLGRWDSPGVRTGWATFRTNSAEQRVGAVQATIRVLPAWEATPIGLIANISEDAPRHASVVLRPAVPNAPVPAGIDVSLCDPPGAVTCELTGPNAAGEFSLRAGLDVSFIPRDRVAGRAVIRVLDKSANCLLEVPFVWYCGGR